MSLTLKFNQLAADAELGRTTAGLIHDFKTPLSSLKLVVSLIDDARGGRRVALAAINQIEQISNSTLTRLRHNLGFSAVVLFKNEWKRNRYLEFE